MSDLPVALGDQFRSIDLPAEERLANVERFVRCVTVRFRRANVRPQEADLAKLMPTSLARGVDAWAYSSCAVCLADFAEGEELRRANCAGGHVFHPRCLRGWLDRSHSTCPVCRGEDERKTAAPNRPSPEALAEYVVRRGRSMQTEHSVSKPHARRAAEVVRRAREPVVVDDLSPQELSSLDSQLKEMLEKRHSTSDAASNHSGTKAADDEPRQLALPSPPLANASNTFVTDGQ